MQRNKPDVCAVQTQESEVLEFVYYLRSRNQPHALGFGSAFPQESDERLSVMVLGRLNDRRSGRFGCRPKLRLGARHAGDQGIPQSAQSPAFDRQLDRRNDGRLGRGSR